MTSPEELEQARVTFATQVSDAIGKLRDSLDLNDMADLAAFIQIAISALSFDIGYVDALGCLYGIDRQTRDKLAKESVRAGKIDVLTLFQNLGYEGETMKRLTDEIFPN